MFRSSRLPTVFAVAAAALLAAATLATPARAATADPFAVRSGAEVLQDDLLGGLDALPGSAVDPARTIHVGVSLQRPDAAGEDAYLADVYDPSSPNYRHFLSVTGWQERFGVPQARYDAAVDWLRSQGLTTSAVEGDTGFVFASGSAAVVAQAFATTLSTYTVGQRSFYANTAPPTVPAALGVLTVVGLQDFTHMKTMQQWAVENGSAPAAGVPVSSGDTTPSDLWSIYHQPPENTGQHQQLAVFGWGVTDASSSHTKSVEETLRSFEQTYGLPQAPFTVSHYGPASEQITDDGAFGEWTLDTSASTGMAPRTDGEHLYFGKSGEDADIIAAYAAWNADATGPQTGSSSFAGCEATSTTAPMAGGPGNPTTGGGPLELAIGNPDQVAFEAQLKVTVGLGRTMFVSAGDLGPNGCPYSFLTALNGATTVPTYLNNYPTVSRYVVGVGGTIIRFTPATMSTPAVRTLEAAWNASGGGTSISYDQPPYQQTYLSATTTRYPCPQDPQGALYPAGTNCRLIPDVAAQSGDLFGAYVGGGGTSLSAPLWNGMWSRIQAASPTPLGFANPLIYRTNADPTTYARDFFDVGNATNTATTEIFASTGIPGYNYSSTGWDYITGWGVPDVTNLMKTLNNGNVTPVVQAGSGGNPPAVPEAQGPVWLLLAAVTSGGVFLAVRRRRALRA